MFKELQAQLGEHADHALEERLAADDCVRLKRFASDQASAHLIQNGDKVWIFNEKGQLIISKLSPKGYTEISRAQLLKPTLGQLNQRGGVTWSHPAFAYQHIFARNDEELICASLKAPTG